MRPSTADARRLLPLPLVWQRLGIPGDPPPRDGRNTRCPWPQQHQHADRAASFGTYAEGTRFKCFGCGAQGDAVDLIARWRGAPRAEAYRLFMEWAGHATAHAVFPYAPQPVKASPGALLLPEIRRLSGEEIAQCAVSRGISTAAVSLAQAMHCVRRAEVFGHPSWILTDPARIIAEARRLDGQPYPALGELQPRKAHTLKGSRKSWPAGVAVLERIPRFRGPILLVEGGPDYLAALHFALEHEAMNVLPIAILGRSAARTALHPRALALLRGRRVRLYPHADADGGGFQAAQAWAAQLQQQGCEVDAFDFRGLSDAHGAPLKDLNDLVRLPPEQRHRIRHLLP
jgi:hypothetical protein